jgi:MerC mercury resistance protein
VPSRIRLICKFILKRDRGANGASRNHHIPRANSRADRFGMVVASLCFVHCIAGPVLLTLVGFRSLIHVSERFEYVFLLASAAMGLAALLSCLSQDAWPHFLSGDVLRYDPADSRPTGSQKTGLRSGILSRKVAKLAWLAS